MTALDFERSAPARGRQTKRVIVVGAGLGGLAAAMTLAAQGAAVTLLERANRTGGKLRAFDSAAGPVDAGPTVLTMRHVLEDLFARTGARLEERVTLTREPLLARHFWHDGAQLDLFDDRDRSAEAVRAFAGAKLSSVRVLRYFGEDDAPPPAAAGVSRAARPPG